MAARGIIRLFTATATALLGVAVALPASATSEKSGDYYQPPTPYHNVGDADPECSGLDLTVHYDYEGVSAIRNLRGSGGQAFLSSDKLHFSEIWVDNTTGDVVITAQGARSWKEVSGRPVPNSSVPAELIPPEGLVGPIYVFRTVEKGWQVVRDADGKPLYRDRGSILGRSLFDTLGDSQPGGTELSFDIVKVNGPHPLLDIDICDVVAAQLTN